MVAGEEDNSDFVHEVGYVKGLSHGMNDVYECILAEPNLASKPNNDLFWRITLQKDSSIGEIVYGRV